MKSGIPGLIALLLTLAACSGLPRQDDPTRDWAAQRFYSEGQDALKAQNYRLAIDYFGQLQRRHPKDDRVPQAVLETAYAWYKLGDADEAVATANRYIDNFTSPPYVDYAYYLKGLARYQEGVQAIQTAPMVESVLPAKSLRDAFAQFATLTRRFPNSKYTEDALRRMVEIRNRLGAHEAALAQRDLEQGRTEEAAKRAEYIVEHYEHSPATLNAYRLLVTAYTELGLLDRAANAQLQLQRKFPEQRLTRPEADQPSRAPGVITTEPRAAVIDVPEIKESTTPEIARLAEPSAAQQNATDTGTRTLPAGPTTNTLRTEQWLLSQNPDYYTLQLLGTGDRKALMRFIDRHGLSDRIAYFSGRHDGRDWYSLVYGSYPTRDAARQAKDDLPPALRRPEPWVRPLGDIQATIRQHAAASASAGGTVAPAAP